MMFCKTFHVLIMWLPLLMTRSSKNLASGGFSKGGTLENDLSTRTNRNINVDGLSDTGCTSQSKHRSLIHTTEYTFSIHPSYSFVHAVSLSYYNRIRKAVPLMYTICASGKVVF